MSLPSQREVPPGVHGALDWEELHELGIDPDSVLDFSSNVNPFAPSDEIRKALECVRLDRYPDRSCLALRNALAKQLDVPAATILAGNGVSELIALVAHACIRPTDRVLVIGPTYGEYARAALLQNARVTTWRAAAECDFAPSPGQISEQLHLVQPRLIFVCNPNNPTGSLLAPGEFTGWIDEFPETLFVVDEAYLPFTWEMESVANGQKKNLLVLRSMTKDFGLPALRLGYVLAHAERIAALKQWQPPWSVNAMAQAAGVAALDQFQEFQHSLQLLVRAKNDLVAELTRRGWKCHSSATHFFLLRAPQGNGQALRRALLKHGVLVRDCASFELPAWVRIATRRPQENERLLAALAEVR